MDRLICGDVGFGKTEVALRAAFVAAMDGKQVAVVVPTTLLARQHYQDLHRALPRLAGARSRRPRGWSPRKELARGQEGPRRRHDRHRRSAPTRCSARAIKFKDLGLLIVDEEQHFGVAHKERLKAAARRGARADADRDADPAHAAAGADRRARAVAHRHAAGRPAGGAHLRLAVRPADRSARRCCASAIAAARLLCRARASRISPSVKDFLDKHVPEVKVAVAHGQMPPTDARGHHDRPSTTASTTCCCRPRSSNPASTSRPPTR